MGQEPRKGSDVSSRASRAGSGESGGKNHDVARRFAWEIAAINVHLQEIRYFWARTLGVSGPQWMILMALADLDQGEAFAWTAVRSRELFESSEAQAGIAAFNARTAAPWVPAGWHAGA